MNDTSVENVLQEELERAQQLTITHIRVNGQNASGRTAASLHVEVNGEGGTLFGRSFFGVLETGRRAGRVPYRFADIIYQWMQDKGVHGVAMPYKTDRAHKYTAQERGDRSLAAAIAHTIKKKGTKLYRTGGRADVYSNVIPEAVQRIKRRILGGMALEVNSIKINKQEV